MKHVRFLGCVWMAMMGSSSFVAASLPLQNEPNVQVISLLELSEKTIEEFSQGKMSGYVLECPEGVSLPLKMRVRGEFLALESESVEPMHLRVLKSCYIRCEERENFLFSSDLQTWEGCAEFFTGELKVSVESQDGVPVAGLELELNQRKAPA
jgi:hypothetical protein